MPILPRFIIVEGRNVGTLQGLVNQKLSEGYVPEGALTVAGRGICQNMIRSKANQAKAETEPDGNVHPSAEEGIIPVTTPEHLVNQPTETGPPQAPMPTPPAVEEIETPEKLESPDPTDPDFDVVVGSDRQDV